MLFGLFSIFEFYPVCVIPRRPFPILFVFLLMTRNKLLAITSISPFPLMYSSSSELVFTFIYSVHTWRSQLLLDLCDFRTLCLLFSSFVILSLSSCFDFFFFMVFFFKSYSLPLLHSFFYLCSSVSVLVWAVGPIFPTRLFSLSFLSTTFVPDLLLILVADDLSEPLLVLWAVFYLHMRSFASSSLWFKLFCYECLLPFLSLSIQVDCQLSSTFSLLLSLLLSLFHVDRTSSSRVWYVLSWRPVTTVHDSISSSVLSLWFHGRFSASPHSLQYPPPHRLSSHLSLSRFSTTRPSSPRSSPL